MIDIHNIGYLPSLKELIVHAPRDSGVLSQLFWCQGCLLTLPEQFATCRSDSCEAAATKFQRHTKYNSNVKILG
jgi:hypothetical protein